MKKQIQLTFSKGLTNVPSDAVCSDNELEQAEGMVYYDGEHHVVQLPRIWAQTNLGTLLFIHKYGDETRNIYLNDKFVCYNGAQLCRVSGTPAVTAVGKVLIVNDKNGLHYFLWQENVYSDVTGIGSPKIDFTLRRNARKTGKLIKTDGLFEFYDVGDTHSVSRRSSTDYDENEGLKKQYDDLMIGAYSEVVKKAAEVKSFSRPFMVRFALEFHDGSYSFISQPMMMLPAVTENCWCEVHGNGATSSVCVFGYRLFFKGDFDYTQYSDLVKGVSVFVSDGIGIYDQTKEEHKPRYAGTVSTEVMVADAISYITPSDHQSGWGVGNAMSPSGESLTEGKNEYVQQNYLRQGAHSRCFLPLIHREQTEINRDLREVSVFYKIADLGLKSDGTWQMVKIREHTLENLTTQDQLPYDDFFSRSPLYANLAYTYNSRLNIANVSRGFFEGYGNFMPLDDSTNHTYDFYVTIDTGNKTYTVQHTEVTNQKQGIYFNYPDARAKHVLIVKDESEVVLNADLKEAPGLNMSYYFAGLSTAMDEQSSDLWDHDEVAEEYRDWRTTTENAVEVLPNYVVTSEVGNPMLMLKKGHFTVGTGKILGMSTITQALSQGQFGQYPLIVFSESGIWAVSFNDEGYFTAVDPMPREVCDNANTITQTDSAIFFTSKKGLMMLTGNEVRCVSEQLSGKTEERLKIDRIAYDYRDSLLWLFCDDKTYVYSIKAGTFSTVDFEADTVVNNYPDTLLQKNDKVYSLMERKNINNDTGQYEAVMVTRPMKLENAMALKTILQVKHVADLHRGEPSPLPGEPDKVYYPNRAYMTFVIEASNNLQDWCRITSLRGTPWKYYRFTYRFYKLLATDTFSGTLLLTEERRTNKLR